MCGLFGFVSNSSCADTSILKSIIKDSQSRGRDSSGLIFLSKDYEVHKIDQPVKKLLSKLPKKSKFICGHTRLITNGFADNQPVQKENFCAIHNGIITNRESLWSSIDSKPSLEIDSEILIDFFSYHLSKKLDVEYIAELALKSFEGIVNCGILISEIGKYILLSNNGSLYYCSNKNGLYFASEKYFLENAGLGGIEQLKNSFLILDVEIANIVLKNDEHTRNNKVIYEFINNTQEEELLEYRIPDLKRCKKCILPETMPFIKFNNEGVCNYCDNYKIRNNPKPKEELLKELEAYRRFSGPDCLVPFSGGRDSCMGLHLIIEELDMKPITYTYDWGMVTDLGRRNISRMCSKLGIENIIIAADIHQKRQNIKKNILAWLKHPNLGMVNIFTAGDKHFFRYIEQIKKQTGIDLNIWSVNPLEVTHFKAGFLGMPPEFEEDKVYYNGISKQLRYHKLRLKEMVNSFGYFNTSLFDTLRGEYYRSFMKKNDYFHLFDYWRWDEKSIDQTLLGLYDWEKAPDTTTTWRIGDGTAAFYNYIYYTVAGFSEHDTFRSNQVREGDLSRDEALNLAIEENRPRYQNLRWYLDCIGLDFKLVINTINTIPKLYKI